MSAIGPYLSGYAKAAIDGADPQTQVSILMHILYEIEAEWAEIQARDKRRVARIRRHRDPPPPLMSG